MVDCKDDYEKFQANINSLHQWSTQYKMPCNAAKCKVITFGKKVDQAPVYYLGEERLTVVDDILYLGVTIQSDLEFSKHVTQKSKKAKQILGTIKRTLFNAPERAKLLAYASLCRPIIEYGAPVWDPRQRNLVDKLEMVQRQAVRFIMNVKGRDSVTEARNEIGLKTLEDRRKDIRMSLLMRILAKENCHQALNSTYDELMKENNHQIATRSITRGEPRTIYAASSVYFNSFLPRTVRELKGKLDN